MTLTSETQETIRCQDGDCAQSAPATIHVACHRRYPRPDSICISGDTTTATGYYFCGAHALEHYRAHRDSYTYTPLPGADLGDCAATRLAAWGQDPQEYVDAPEWRHITTPLWAPNKPYDGPRDKDWAARPLPAWVLAKFSLTNGMTTVNTRAPKTRAARKVAKCCRHCGGAL